MERSYLEYKLESYYKDIYGKNNIIKELDFSNDIDIERSDRFKLKKQEGCLEFLCKDIAIVKPADYSIILGGLKEKEDDSVRLVSSLEKITGDSFMRAYSFINRKVLFDETDILFFDIERSNEFAFNIGFNNYSRYKWMNKIRNNEVDFFGKNEDRISFMSTFARDKAVINLINRSGNKLVHTIDIQNTPSIQYTINLRENFIKLNEKKYRTPIIKSLSMERDYYINIALLPVKEQEQIPWVNSKSIVYGKEQGYIYFKFDLKDYVSKNIGIFCISSASLQIQAYSNMSKKWQDLNQESCKIDHMDIQIRVKMKYGDRLYKILIAQRD